MRSVRCRTPRSCNWREMIEFKAWQRAELYDTTHDAMVSLVEWCTGTIPFSFDFVIDHHAEVATRPLDRILFDLSEMRSGCMCGGLSKLMAQLARREGFDAVELNFG